MNYKKSQTFNHHQADKIGVLITNLGTPEAPTAKALKPYLKQFLWDPRVVEVPRPIWWLILNGIILNTRPKKSAEAYKTVWTEKGSPLALHTADQAEKLQAHFGDRLIVDWAMRYGEPSIGSALQKMQDAGVRKLIVLPLYPQYAAATTASTFDALADDFKTRRWMPELRFINQYADFEPYIDTVADSIKAYQAEHGKADKLVFSYHGIPLRYLHNGDPYHCQCLKTTRLVAEKLGLNPDQYLTSFQSRFGKEEWIKPYTDATLKSLPAQGVKNVQVICPGFSADCLETIEEIGEENREYFEEAGGEQYGYIPALNASEPHIETLAQLIELNLQGWQTLEPDLTQREALYQGCPHNKPD